MQDTDVMVAGGVGGPHAWVFLGNDPPPPNKKKSQNKNQKKLN